MAEKHVGPDDGPSPTDSGREPLRNRTRQAIVDYLRDNGGEASIPELAGTVRDGNEPLYEVITTLHDVHLPHLERHGYVEITTEEKRIRLVDGDEKPRRS